MNSVAQRQPVKQPLDEVESRAAVIEAAVDMGALDIDEAARADGGADVIAEALALRARLVARAGEVEKPNAAWAGDITYIPTREGWLYLAVLLDLYSRIVVGWSMRDDMERQLCLDALTMALKSRRPGPGLLHHTDRGSQYASHDYRAVLDANGIVCSMSRKGDCWDNAVAESFFKTLKAELVDDADFATRDEARRAIFEFIEVWYNRQRLHSHLDYKSPREYEASPHNAAVAA